jgi:hypothetical protein
MESSDVLLLRRRLGQVTGEDGFFPASFLVTGVFQPTAWGTRSAVRRSDEVEVPDTAPRFCRAATRSVRT